MFTMVNSATFSSSLTFLQICFFDMMNGAMLGIGGTLLNLLKVKSPFRLPKKSREKLDDLIKEIKFPKNYRKHMVFPV